MADDFENVGASYVAGTEEVYRELARKADLLRRGQMSEDQVAAAFDEIVGIAGEGEEEGGGGAEFGEQAKDEQIEDLMDALTKQAKEMERTARIASVQDFDRALDSMTGEKQGTDMEDALSQLDSIKF